MQGSDICFKVARFSTAGRCPDAELKMTKATRVYNKAFTHKEAVVRLNANGMEGREYWQTRSRLSRAAAVRIFCMLLT
jgi:hypothetical protein